jgi:uncharacterized protein (TIGR02145 family)/uncharacterized repeat protein (TIGR02543 family)
MKKRNYFLTAFIVAAISVSSAFAQDYNITFAILGSSEKPETIKVENITQSTEKTLSGSDVLNLIKDISSGIDDRNENVSNALQVTPNPLKETAIVTFRNPAAGKVNVSVVNSAGAQVARFSSELPQGEINYTLSGLSTGIYVVNVQSAGYRASSVILSQLESTSKPSIVISSTAQEPRQSILKSTKSVSETIQMQYTTGDVLKFTATLNAKNAYADHYTASQNDEIEFSFTYTVTFNNWDNLEIDTYDGEYADTIIYPAHPNNREGYIANGWDAENATVPANDDLVITAQYSIVPFTISYNNVGTKNGAANPASYTIETADITLVVPTDSAGFTFGGWFTDAAFIDTVSTPAIAQGSIGETVFYAKWVITDSRDDNVYQTVAIGNQIWMAENLRYLPDTVHSNADFETAGNSSQPGYGIYGYNGSVVAEAKAVANYSTYGVLYNWYAVNENVCPIGWHVPTDAEWTTLTDYLGGTSVAGGKLKETGTTHWNSPNNGATNETGFTALPGGFRSYGGTFGTVGSSGYWWSSAEYSTTSAWSRNMSYDGSSVDSYGYGKQDGFSVRCLRD